MALLPTQTPISLLDIRAGLGARFDTTFTTAGSQVGAGSFSVPSDTHSLYIVMWGGGQGGGGGGTLGFGEGGLGGTSGGCVAFGLFGAEIPSSFNYFVGAGGGAGSPGQLGGSGQNTSITIGGVTRIAGGGQQFFGGTASGGNIFNIKGNTPFTELGAAGVLNPLGHFGGMITKGVGGLGGPPFGSGSVGDPGGVYVVYFRGGAPNNLRAYIPNQPATTNRRVARHENNTNAISASAPTILQFLNTNTPQGRTGPSRSFVTPMTVEVRTLVIPFGGTVTQKGYGESGIAFLGSVTFTQIGKTILQTQSLQQCTMLRILEVISGGVSSVQFTVAGDQRGTWWNEIGLADGPKIKRQDTADVFGSYNSSGDFTNWTWQGGGGQSFSIFTQQSTGPGVLNIDPAPLGPGPLPPVPPAL